MPIRTVVAPDAELLGEARKKLLSAKALVEQSGGILNRTIEKGRIYLLPTHPSFYRGGCKYVQVNAQAEQTASAVEVNELLLKALKSLTIAHGFDPEDSVFRPAPEISSGKIIWTPPGHILNPYIHPLKANDDFALAIELKKVAEKKGKLRVTEGKATVLSPWFREILGNEKNGGQIAAEHMASVRPKAATRSSRRHPKRLSFWQ